jgi:uncharacterized membrane protein YhiD involved in acid resistance
VNEFQNMIDSSIAHVYMPNEIIINLILSLVLGFLVSYVYKSTHKGLSYSQSFMITSIFIAVIVCMVIMVIGNNLARAFALVGALSIIRFRTVVKDTKDTAYIFWALAVGMAAGTGSYFLAIAGSGVVVFTAYLLYYTNYGSVNKSEFILQFRVDVKNISNKNTYNDILQKYSKSSTLLHSQPSGDGKTIKLTFDVVMKKDENSEDFCLEFSNIGGIDEVDLVAAKHDIDY